MQDTGGKVRELVAQALRDAAAAIEEPPASSFRPRRPPADDDGGTDHAHVYFAGCSSLFELSRRLGGVPIFKVGATQQRLRVRQDDLRQDRYGAGVRRSDGFVLEEGFDDWEMRRVHRIAVPAGCPVSLAPRALTVRLAQPFPRFEEALRDALRPRSLDVWARSPDGRHHLAGLGVDPREARRYTLYGFGEAAGGSDTRRSRCSELYVIRPREDLREIVATVAAAASGTLGSLHHHHAA